VCIFYGHAGHLDEFYFRCKRIEKRRFEYARNSYRGEFLDFTPRSYYRASPRTYSRALPQFSHRPNHHSYGFGSRENRFMAKRFGYGPRPHRGDRFPCRSVFLLEGPTLTLSRDTWTVHVFSIVVHVPLGQVVRCKGLRKLLSVAWLSAGFQRFISLTPTLSHRHFLILCR
jgi:hypothetical protein